jgi:hypothetical protein
MGPAGAGRPAPQPVSCGCVTVAARWRLQRAVPKAVGDGVEARVLHEVVEAEERAEAGEQVVVGGAHREVAVAGAEGLVGRVQTVRGPEAARHLAREPVLRRLPRRERQAGLEERGVDQLATPRQVARPEGAQDAERRTARPDTVIGTPTFTARRRRRSRLMPLMP